MWTAPFQNENLFSVEHFPQTVPDSPAYKAFQYALVMDSLNTHKPASLYKRILAEEARRIIKKLETHYTPKHGSWLDIAEIELNVMTRQCLSHRIDEIDKLRSELAAWQVERNTLAAKVNWHFQTRDARIKLSSLYPTFTTATD